MSFPVGSLGLEEGRGGGTRAPAVNGVVGLFGAGTTHTQTQTHTDGWVHWSEAAGKSFFNSNILLIHLANLQQKTLFSR